MFRVCGHALYCCPHDQHRWLYWMFCDWLLSRKWPAAAEIARHHNSVLRSGYLCVYTVLSGCYSQLTPAIIVAAADYAWRLLGVAFCQAFFLFRTELSKILLRVPTSARYENGHPKFWAFHGSLKCVFSSEFTTTSQTKHEYRLNETWYWQREQWFSNREWSLHTCIHNLRNFGRQTIKI